jgi:hypothetical protein
MKAFRGSILFLAALTASGCAYYRTPGAGVSIPSVTDAGISEAMARVPAATFPARLAVVRVQAASYSSRTAQGYGSGRFSVVTTRDVETEADFARLAALPGVAAIGAVNRLLLPGSLESAKDLRIGAAQLKADIVMLYTIDTTFRTDTRQIGPLQLVSLGFFPNKKAKVQSTCAAAFIDTRTGFVYGVAEATAAEEQRSDVWNKQEAIEKARARAERAAFTKALGEVEKVWPSIVAAGGASAGSSTTPANPTP